jgi:hypothetical protein
MGGSASAMANQIAEGFILLSPATIRSYTPNDLQSLKVELEKLQRDTRAVVPPQDDAQANQLKNRKISRLSSAIQIVGGRLSERR